MFAKQHDRDPSANDKDADPSLHADALAKKQHRADCTGCVAKRRNRYDEAYIFEGQRCQKREKRDRHHADADPHPRHRQGFQDKSRQRQRPEIGDLADLLHGPSHAELATRAGHHDHTEQKEFAHVRL
jgi:hypothetical protein